MFNSTRATRPIALIGGTTLALSIALTGCTSEGENGGSETLVIQTGFEAGSPRAAIMEDLLAAFTEETGITVDEQPVANLDMVASFETAALAGEEPDIVIHNLVPDNSDWFTDGLTIDVGPLIDEWGLADRLQPAGIEYWTQNGGLNGIPWSSFNWPIWYNMDLLGQAGIDEIPATFDELLDAAAALRQAGIQPFALGGGEWPGQNFATWMAQQYLDADAAAEIFANGGYCANPDAVKGLDLLAQMRDAGVFVDNVEGYTADQMTTAYFNGEAAMMPSGSWGYASAPPEIAAVTELGGFPVVDGGVYDSPTAYNGYNTGIFISRNGETKLDAVQQFVEFWYTPENLLRFVTEAGDILAVNADALGEIPETEFPLVGKGNQIDENVVSFMLLPDGFWPSGYDGAPASAQFFGSDMGGDEYCVLLDDIYATLQ